MSILDEVTKQVESMSADDLRKQFAEMQERRAKQKEKQKERNADPAVKEKRLAYSKAYREKNPEKFAEQRKAYMQRPEVKERMKSYRQTRQAREKAILKRAKELGITGAESVASGQ